MKKLKQDYKAVTVLMFLIICLGVMVSASLLQHSGSKNSFSVNIVSPAGGEAWQGNTAQIISYTISGGVPNYTVEFFYTTDNVNFNFIDYDNRTAEGSFDYTWTTPEITSENVKVKIVVTDNITGNSSSQVSYISSAFEIDSTAPGAVVDLSVWNITKTSVTLNWTAPGDDNNAGTATNYDIRYSTSEINDANWGSAIQVADELAPSSANTPESFTVIDLLPGTTYYFALKTTDNVVLISNLSNCVNASTLLNVTLISPVGNEEWKGNTNCTIEYRIDGVESPYVVEFYYAYNNSDFILINSTTKTEAGTHQYIWTTPNILSVTVKVKINVTDSTGFSDVRISDEFEIDSIPPGKINDLSVTGVTINSATLNWTAPGDDGSPLLLLEENNTDVQIPDWNATGNFSEISIGKNIVINTLKVYLRINHTWVGELTVRITHPDGTNVTLFNETGGSADNIFGWYEDQTFTLQEGGATNLTPCDSLTIFKGKLSQGTWKLTVIDLGDVGPGQTGNIDLWKIEISAPNATQYELRYNTTIPITESNWNESVSCEGMPRPGKPGASEEFVVCNLLPAAKYYFALKTIDNVGWHSEVSNSALAYTLVDVKLNTPNGGEIWSGNSEHIISYTIVGEAPAYEITLNYSLDGGHTYPDFGYIGKVDNVGPGTHQYIWTVPLNDSVTVKVSVNASTAVSYGIDTSDNNFTIDSTPPYVKNATSNVSILADEKIVLEFSEPMNSSSVESAFSSTPSIVGISWSWNNNFTIATISHDDFTENQLYNCKINTTAKDISEPGNSLLEDYFFNFTVVKPLSVRVIYPNGNEPWDGTKNQTIAYEILGGAPPYNITLYWLNATDDMTGLIGYDTKNSSGEHSWIWESPLITNNTLKIKVAVTDNTTPFQTAYDLSDWVFEIDSTPPGKPELEPPAPDSIAKEGYPRAHAVKLKWKAPGDDGDTGKVSYYEIRYFKSYITEDNWDDIPSYQRFNYPASSSAGKFDSYIINGLEDDTVYYFRIKAYDNVGFVSELSNCISIKTLKFEAWSNTMEGVPGFEWINNTLHIISDKTVSYTEVLMKGNLRVVNNKELKFEKVLFIMDCTEDWEYRIQVAPGGLAGFLEGGKFELQYSNISASVSTMPDGSERWHPYLFTAYRNSKFWMFYSSMHHCGGKPEDIENIELGFAQMDVELDVELGIEIRSSAVSIENSTISQNWGIFIRTSLPMAASPTIKYNTIEHNRYGIVIKPKIDITEQWPINLIVNNISNNGIGVYSDSARVGLEGCQFIRNTYGVIYNNTPLDWPHNVSGVIYHCVFENNIHGINSTNSFLMLEAPVLSNNMYAINATKSVLTIESGIVSFNRLGLNAEFSSVAIHDSRIVNNTLAADSYDTVYGGYLVYEGIYTNEGFGGIYCKGTVLNIDNCNISNNLNSITAFITNISISNSTLSENQYVILDDETGMPIVDRWGDTVWDGWGVYAEGTFPVNISKCSITGNQYGAMVVFGFLRVSNCSNISWNGLKYFGVGILYAYGEANITGNIFRNNSAAFYAVGAVSIPNLNLTIGLPFGPFRVLPKRILDMMSAAEGINVKGGLYNNQFLNNAESVYIIESGLVEPFKMINNTIHGIPIEEGPGYLYVNVWVLWSDCIIQDVVIDTGLIGIIYLDSTMNIKNCVIKNNGYGNILSLHLLLWWWYPEYAAEIPEDTIINMDDVDILSSAYYGVAASNTTITITNSNISGNDAGIYCEFTDISIENVNVTDNNEDGVYVSAGTLTAAHTNFTGNTAGVSASDAEIYVTECDFKDNSRGISSSWSSGYIELNTIKGGTGVDSLYSDLFISDNHFIDCITGVNSNNDFLEITGNVMEGCIEGIKLSCASGNITGNKIDGLGAAKPYARGILVSYQGAGGVYIADNEIWRYNGLYPDGRYYGKGIECIDAYPTIYDNILAENVIGIYFTNSNEKYATIEENTLCNNTYGIQSTNSNLNMVNNTVGWNIPDSEAGTYGIYGQNSGLSITGNDIIHNYYGVWCEGSTLNVTGASLSWNTYGIYVTPYVTQSVTLYSSACINGATISNNSYGAYFEKSPVSISNASVVNNSMANDSYGVYLYKCPDPEFPGVPVKIINSTILNNIVDLNISDSRIEAVTSTIGIIYLSSSTISSSLECTDFTPDFSNITFADSSSKMEVSFYLTVFVKWQNNEPVNNASVTIYNKNNVPTNLSTDSNGTLYTKILALTMNKTTHPNGVLFMPHRVNASKYDISNETEPFYVNETRYVELVLYDDVLPSISIDPVFFSITNKPLLTLTGSASDNIEIWGVEITIDNIIWTRCDLTIVNSTPGNYTVSWSGSVTLSEGLNTVYVRAKDFAGNNITGSVTITLDTTPPALVITSPIPERTNQPTLTIMGETEIGATVTINSASVPVDENGNFNKTFNLNEGVNVFTVVASDAIGNENRIVLQIIVFDNTPPSSSIAYIKSPTNTLTSISGVANDDISGVKKVEICITRGSDGYYWTGSAWSSSETWLNALGTETWSYTWTPESDGVYTIKSRATDNADNTEIVPYSITFTYDKTPPTLKNIKPSNNSETESETITVSGGTDGVSVTVNGVSVDVENGKFSATVKLGTGNNGRNVITIIATDSAGNTNQTTIIVKRTPGWVPPSTAWIGLLAGIIVIALITSVFVLHKKKIIMKVKASEGTSEKAGTGETKNS